MAAKFSMLHTEKVERCRGLGIPALACSVAVFGAELHKTLLVEIMSPCTRTHTHSLRPACTTSLEGQLHVIGTLREQCPNYSLGSLAPSTFSVMWWKRRELQSMQRSVLQIGSSSPAKTQRETPRSQVPDVGKISLDHFSNTVQARWWQVSILCLQVDAQPAAVLGSSRQLLHSIWVVVKNMVPFGVLIIIRHLLFRVPKKGPQF